MTKQQIAESLAQYAISKDTLDTADLELFEKARIKTTLTNFLILLDAYKKAQERIIHLERSGNELYIIHLCANQTKSVLDEALEAIQIGPEELERVINAIPYRCSSCVNYKSRRCVQMLVKLNRLMYVTTQSETRHSSFEP